MSEYQVPQSFTEVEYQVKKSRFIARVDFAQDRAAAMASLARAKTNYPDARHHCWAYIIGDPNSPTTVAMSDDGEPSGTAGKPILNVLQHKLLGDIVVVVSRYFGGIKLGAGGLVRAYSSATQMVIDKLVTTTVITLLPISVSGPYALEQPLRHWLTIHGGEIASVIYGETTKYNVLIKVSDKTDLQAFIAAQHGSIETL